VFDDGQIDVVFCIPMSRYDSGMPANRPLARAIVDVGPLELRRQLPY
jgi:hypothetical protein